MPDLIEPSQCRQLAETAIEADSPTIAVAWALLAAAGELTEIRRELKRSR